MHRSRLPLLGVTTLALLALPALAGAAEATAARRMFLVHVEKPIPSKIAEYEATTRDFNALLHENHRLMPAFGYTTLQGDDLSYNFISPLRGYADLDTVTAGFEALVKAAPERWKKLMEDSSRAMASVDDYVLVEVADASYWPANAKNSPDDPYHELNFYRVVPGMDEAAGEISASWKALYQSKGFPYGYTVYRMAFGEDGPLWIVGIPAKSPADLAAIQEASRRALGDAFKSQMAKTMSATRSVEVRRYWVRPDLSVKPAAAPASR